MQLFEHCIIVLLVLAVMFLLRDRRLLRKKYIDLHAKLEQDNKIASLKQELENQLTIKHLEDKHYVALAAERQLLTTERDNYHTQLSKDSEHYQAQLATNSAIYEQRILDLQQQLTALQRSQDTIEKQSLLAFEDVANKVLDKNQEKFKFSSTESLMQTINPLKHQLHAFSEQVNKIYADENASRNQLYGQITEFHKSSLDIGTKAENLTNALKGNNKIHGTWGELILKNVLNMSGLQENRDYYCEETLKNDEGSHNKPDVVLCLPDGKHIIIDAKTPLVSFERYQSSNDTSTQHAELNELVRAIEKRIKDLSNKDYHALNKINTADFVYLFIPIDFAVMLAMQHKQELYQFAWNHKIIIVSPATLLSSLRIIENIWRIDKQNKNVTEIVKLGQSIYDQCDAFLDDMSKIKKALDDANKAYNTAYNRLSTGNSNLIRNSQKLIDLGIKSKIKSKKSNKGLPEEVEVIE